MWLIRREQMEAFERVAFMKWLPGHLKAFFPDECRALGEAGLEQRIREGERLASGYGFNSGRDIAHFITLGFVHGPGFDRTSWASRILGDRFGAAPALRIRRLQEASRQHLQHAE